MGLGGFVVVVLLTFLGLLAITFFIGRIVPIDPVLSVVGDRATKEVYENARIAMGLDRPLIVQFASYVGDVLTGNLGMSVSTGRPVAEDLARVFPATLEMATLGILIGVLLGVPMGLIAANRQGTWIDQAIRVVGLLGYSVPAFWLGLVGLLLFYARLGWVAGPGRIDIFYDGLVPPVTGLLLVDSLIAGDLGHLRQRRQPPDPAGVDPRLLQPRLHRAHDPLVHARPARPGVHHHRAGQGRVRSAACSGCTPSGRSGCR